MYQIFLGTNSHTHSVQGFKSQCIYIPTFTSSVYSLSPYSLQILVSFFSFLFFLFETIRVYGVSCLVAYIRIHGLFLLLYGDRFTGWTLSLMLKIYFLTLCNLSSVCFDFKYFLYKFLENFFSSMNCLFVYFSLVLFSFRRQTLFNPRNYVNKVLVPNFEKSIVVYDIYIGLINYLRVCWGTKLTLAVQKTKQKILTFEFSGSSWNCKKRFLFVIACDFLMSRFELKYCRFWFLMWSKFEGHGVLISVQSNCLIRMSLIIWPNKFEVCFAQFMWIYICTWIYVNNFECGIDCLGAIGTDV